jgi:hypothetical protein
VRSLVASLFVVGAALLLTLPVGCSYPSYHRAHSQPLHASFMGQPVSFSFFGAGMSAQWHSFWFEGTTVPIECDKRPIAMNAMKTVDTVEFSEFSFAMVAKELTTGRHEVRPDPTTAPSVNAMMRHAQSRTVSARGINGGAFYIDRMSDDGVDVAIDVDDNLVQLVGTFHARRCE